MEKESDRVDFTEKLMAYASDIADQVITRAERDMLQHPDRYPDYADAVAWLETEEFDLIQKLGEDIMATEAFLNACSAKCAALAAEMYRRGILDGGRIYHAFVMRELPHGSESDT